MPKHLVLLILLLLAPALAGADGGLSVDASFDRTGDGIVDASDWAKMSDEEKRAYADASVRALGEDPDTLLVGGQTRGARYLQGLRAVYE